MKYLLLTLGFLAHAAFCDETPNPLKGYTEINRTIKERIAQTNGFELGQYLGEDSSVPGKDGLLALLGTYVGADTSAGFQNGAANSLNMVLWYIALSSFSQDIASKCSASPVAMPNQLALLSDFQALLQPLCAWPAASAKTDSVLFGFWSGIAGWDAPPSEFQAWEAYFLSSPDYANASASAVIPAMALAVMFNPYFLLAD